MCKGITNWIRINIWNFKLDIYFPSSLVQGSWGEEFKQMVRVWVMTSIHCQLFMLEMRVRSWILVWLMYRGKMVKDCDDSEAKYKGDENVSDVWFLHQMIQIYDLSDHRGTFVWISFGAIDFFYFFIFLFIVLIWKSCTCIKKKNWKFLVYTLIQLNQFI